jgi:uncharacterized membrane protein YkvA (DUF1232 family)
MPDDFDRYWRTMIRGHPQKPKTIPPEAPPRRGKFSDASFLGLVRRSFLAIGEATLTQAFALYHALRDERTPTAAKATIGAALAYLVLPTDFIPDLIPLVGFTDDAGAIAAAATAVAASITPEHRRKAARQAKDLFSRPQEQGSHSTR